MQNRFTLRFTLLLVLSFVAHQYYACKKIDLERQVMIKPLPAQNVQVTTADLFADVIDSGESESVNTFGFVYATSPSPTLQDMKIELSQGFGTGQYNLEATALDPNTEYFYRPFASFNDGEVFYGAGMSFTTQMGNIDPPLVETSGISNITETSATITGNVVADGGAPVTKRGICIGQQANPNINGICSEDGTGTGQFQHTFSNLNPNITYHVRAYAQNQEGIAYGDNLTFTTGGGGPINQWLSYDNGINNDALGFSGFNFDAVIRFPAAAIQQYLGTRITHIRFFPYFGSTAYYSVEMYTGPNPDANNPVFFEDIPPNFVTPGEWTEYPLAESYEITENLDLWVGLYIHNYQAGEYPMGVDSGPAATGLGDLFYNYDSGEWIALSNLEPPFDVNWNLQVFVTNEAGEKVALSLNPKSVKAKPAEGAGNEKISSFKSNHSSTEK